MKWVSGWGSAGTWTVRCVMGGCMHMRAGQTGVWVNESQTQTPDANHSNALQSNKGLSAIPVIVAQGC